MITSKQANAVACLYEGYPVGFPLCSNDIERMIQALEAYEQSKWLAINNHPMPSDGSNVIVRTCGGAVNSCFICSPQSTKLTALKRQGITHWQPLPVFKEANK